MYPTKTGDIVAFARGPAGPAGPINQDDIDALKGGVPVDGDTLGKLYELIAAKAPSDGAGLTNATATTQATGNDSSSLATTAFVQGELATAIAAAEANTDDKIDALTGDWSAYVPVVTAGAGAFASASATGLYKKVGRTVHFWVQVTITTVGTGSLRIEASLPSTSTNIWPAWGDYVNDGKSLRANVVGAVVRASLFDGSFPFGDGTIVRIAGTYQES